MNIKIMDTVEVPEPNTDDIWSHSFIGIVIDIVDSNVIVEDQDSDLFTVEANRVKVINDDDESMVQSRYDKDDSVKDWFVSGENLR